MPLNIVLTVAGFICFLCCGGFMYYSPSVKTTKGTLGFLGGAAGMLASLIIIGISVIVRF